MASISLTDPVAGTTVTAGLHAGNNAALRTAVNGGLDNTNIAGGAAIDLSKLAAVAWTAYSPTWTSAGTAPVLNNGTLVGRYVQIGKTIHMSVIMTAGTTTAFGSANPWSVSLPVAAQNSTAVVLPTRGVDSGINNYQAVAFGATTTTVNPNTINAASGTLSAWTNTLPFAWGTGDIFVIAGTYEAA